ncbi:hypothetical protein PIB30_079646 [Stylosanthes scabra]|uniref:Uncharacterized protein n=1 Tax=Stylosanthes scabra TaxID=79078 RepID=A0ABU6ZPX8_9FABA|nr:hypothetical protein [Stylosanthes scabra]
MTLLCTSNVIHTWLSSLIQEGRYSNRTFAPRGEREREGHRNSLTELRRPSPPPFITVESTPIVTTNTVPATLQLEYLPPPPSTNTYRYHLRLPPTRIVLTEPDLPQPPPTHVTTTSDLPPTQHEISDHIIKSSNISTADHIPAADSPSSSHTHRPSSTLHAATAEPSGTTHHYREAFNIDLKPGASSFVFQPPSVVHLQPCCSPLSTQSSHRNGIHNRCSFFSTYNLSSTLATVTLTIAAVTTIFALSSTSTVAFVGICFCNFGLFFAIVVGIVSVNYFLGVLHWKLSTPCVFA